MAASGAESSSTGRQYSINPCGFLEHLLRKYLKFALLSLLAALILWGLGRSLDWTEVRHALRQTDWRLIALATAIVCLTYLLRAYRWRAFLMPLATTSIRELFAATTVGFGSIFLLGRAGEVVRPAFLPLRDRRVPASAAFVTIAVERVYDMVAIVLLFSANLLLFSPQGADQTAYARVRQAGFILLLGAVLGIVALVLFSIRSQSVIRWIDKRSARASSPVLRRAGSFVTMMLEQWARALGVLVDARELVVTAGWTIVLWGAITLADWLILRAFGLPFGIGETVFVMGWGLVGSLVPTPGGAAGAFHAATAAGLIFLGVPRDQAAAVSIVMHLVVFAPALFFALYYFLRSDIKLDRLRRVAAAPPTENSGALPKPISQAEDDEALVGR